MIHTSEVINYPGSMEELAEEIGNLKYDALEGASIYLRVVGYNFRTGLERISIR
jgi:hypothetical protein